MLIKKIILSLIALLLFSSCSKDLEEFNKPAIYWYSKIIENVSNGNIDKADTYYSSLQSEHIGSILLPNATMILAISHMHYEEYLLSQHFLNEYDSRYASINEKEYVEYMKVKAKYMALPNPRRDQGLIAAAILEASKFKENYPNSIYFPIVDTILTRLFMAENALNESIASLYNRIDKPKASKYYRDLKPQPWIDWSKVNKANSPFYREMFEGDGTGSWYGFMLPDTRSVVSRNSMEQEQKLLNKNVGGSSNDSSGLYK